jgi:hypothetical protein
MIVPILLNGQPLTTDPAPIVERGRMLLPARAVFEALGAAVDYDARRKKIVVRRGAHSATLALGSRAASADGRNVELDAPPRVARGRTFVPLRFIAETLGDAVDYDGTRVSIADAALAPPPQQGAVLPPTVEFRQPAPGEVVAAAFPTISAQVMTHGGPGIDPGSVRVFFDGRDVTDLAYKTAYAVSYAPERVVSAGAHEVTVQGADESGRRFTSNWTFASTFAYQSGPNVYGVPGAPAYPSAYAALPFTFYTVGPFPYAAGNVVNVTLVSPAGGTAYVNLCGYGQYPLSYGPQINRYTAVIVVPHNVFAPVCRVDGYFSDAIGNFTYFSAPQPIVVNTLATPAPPASPAPVVRRRPLERPSPAPSPKLTPSPKPTAAPAHGSRATGAP